MLHKKCTCYIVKQMLKARHSSFTRIFIRIMVVGTNDEALIVRVERG